LIIGAGERPRWDANVTVAYPSPRAFLELVSKPAYATLNDLRVGALERAELIATSVRSDEVRMGVSVGLQRAPHS
jgi:hypothetical protein